MMTVSPACAQRNARPDPSGPVPPTMAMVTRTPAQVAARKENTRPEPSFEFENRWYCAPPECGRVLESAIEILPGWCIGLRLHRLHERCSLPSACHRSHSRPLVNTIAKAGD